MLSVIGVFFLTMYFSTSLLLTAVTCVIATPAVDSKTSSGPIAHTRNGTCKFSEAQCF